MDAIRRTLVLGSGGTTGLAWEVGVLAGLADAGIDVTADRIVGTSAGALLGARLASGWTVGELAALRDAGSFLAGSSGSGRGGVDSPSSPRHPGPLPRHPGERRDPVPPPVDSAALRDAPSFLGGSSGIGGDCRSLRSRRELASDGVTKGSPTLLDATLPVPALARLLAAQLYPSRRHALAWLGRRAAREWTPEASATWIRQVAGDLAGRPWPERLVVVATDATSGRPAFFSANQPADLAAAVAASCAMPGVFPAVRIDDRLLFDGGLRSPVNLDAAGSARVVLAVAPLTGALRPDRRPETQAALLRRAGARVLLLTPDAAGRRSIGVDVLAADRVEAAHRAGRALGLRRADEVRALWEDPERAG